MIAALCAPPGALFARSKMRPNIAQSLLRRDLAQGAVGFKLYVADHDALMPAPQSGTSWRRYRHPAGAAFLCSA